MLHVGAYKRYRTARPNCYRFLERREGRSVSCSSLPTMTSPITLARACRNTLLPTCLPFPIFSFPFPFFHPSSLSYRFPILPIDVYSRLPRRRSRRDPVKRKRYPVGLLFPFVSTDFLRVCRKSKHAK